MKGTPKPQAFIFGKCFICGQKCDDNAYCHLSCAIAMDEEKRKRIKEAVEKAKEEK